MKLVRAWRLAAPITASLVGTLAATAPALAQNATWTGNSNDGQYGTSGNWSPTSVPAGTATFNALGKAPNISVFGNYAVGGWTFGNSATYRFTVSGEEVGSTLTFNGAGMNTPASANVQITNQNKITFNNSSVANANFTNTGLISFNNSSTVNASAIFQNTSGSINFNGNSVGGGSVTNSSGSTIQFSGNSIAGNAASAANYTNSGSINFENNSSAGTASVTNNATGTIFFNNNSSAGSASFINNNILSFHDASTAGSATITNNSRLFFVEGTAGSATITTNSGGTVYFEETGTGGSAQFITNAGGKFDMSLTSAGMTAGSIAGAGDYYLGSRQLTVGSNNLSTEVSGVIHYGGAGGLASGGSLVKVGSGTLTLSGANTYTGGTTVNGGTLALSGAGTLGANTATTTVNSGGTLDLGGTTQTQAALLLRGGTVQNGALDAGINSAGGTINGISGTASLYVVGGTTVVTGTNTFTGGTVVASGATLTVNGSLSDPTIGAGGLLNGTGSVGDTTVQSGGTFAPGSGTPGTSMTVNGNLAFQSGATYQIVVNPAAASSANVTGTATLGGATVSAAFANGGYISKQYTILTAGGVSGSFGTLANSNLPTNFTDKLSYDATHAYLNLALNFTPPPTGPTAPSFGGGLNINQQNVATALVNYFNSTGGIPMVYGTLTPAGLTQASGELATGAQQTTFDAMNLFMGLLTDPFMNRTGGTGSMPGAPGYADESDTNAYAATKTTDAFAMFTKAPIAKAYDPRWSVWAAGYGGSQTTSGNAVLGSNNTTSSVYGTAVGADYLLSPNTIAGFALAGGGTNFSVVNSGSGRSDLFQAGAYIRHTEGPAYISAALAYGWQDITTNRTVTVAGIDQLRAEFNANTYSGRLEGGYRYVAPWTGGVGITPYAAAQFTTFDLPAYAESVVTGTPAFALNYASKSVTDPRSELGIRTDKTFVMQDGILTLLGRVAWAHDYDPNRTMAATFQALPGASFVVNGAAQAADSALTTAGAEFKWRNGWSAAATFEGEFSNVTNAYAGKAIVRYQW